MPEVGHKAPAFEAVDTDGQPIRLSDFAGQTVVLYFYPKDDTPGCTTEACDFRDRHEQLQAAGAVVLGVSRDKPASHRKFVDKYSLPFRLIADTDEKVCRAYDVIQLKTRCGRTSEGVVRTTFVIDGDGVIRARWPEVSVKGHAEAVLKTVQELAPVQ